MNAATVSSLASFSKKCICLYTLLKPINKTLFRWMWQRKLVNLRGERPAARAEVFVYKHDCIRSQYKHDPGGARTTVRSEWYIYHTNDFVEVGTTPLRCGIISYTTTKERALLAWNRLFVAALACQMAVVQAEVGRSRYAYMDACVGARSRCRFAVARLKVFLAICCLR